MKKTSFVLLLACLSLLVSCGPQAYLIESELRGPSASGMNLLRKTIGIAYLQGGDPADSSLNNLFASSFASSLENDYFSGEEEIGLYSIPLEENKDYSDKDYFVDLVLDLDKDVVFLIDRPSVEDMKFSPQEKRNGSVAGLPADSVYTSRATAQFATKIYVYDTQNKEDKVFGFTGQREIETIVYSDGKDSEEALRGKAMKSFGKSIENAGHLAALSFVSKWYKESLFVVYYDGAEGAWTRGAEHAASFLWKEAVDDWMSLMKSKNNGKKACAAYNIALACFMTGQPELALEWIDKSDSYEPISLSATLRKQIERYMNRK